MSKALVLLFTAIVLATAWHYRDSLTERHTPLPAGSWASGVVRWDHWRTSSDDYNIVNQYLDHLECKVMNMAGQLVYEFPHGTCIFFSDGDMMFTDLDHAVRYFDHNAREVWKSADNMHHDFDVSADETEVLVLTKLFSPYPKKNIETNFIKIYDRKTGHFNFSWDADEHAGDFEPLGLKIEFRERDHTFSYFHLNSIQLLPPNPNESKNPAFKAGNLLVNCADNGVVFIVDRASGKIVWQHSFDIEVLDVDGPTRQSAIAHTVKMLPNGNLYFMINNHQFNFVKQFFSTVEEMNPVTGEVIWRYMADPAFTFFTPAWGAAYQLSNGNTLVTHSSAGSAFEINRDGRIVWEWFNPERNAYGFATQIYRVSRVPKKIVDPIIEKWRPIYKQ